MFHNTSLFINSSTYVRTYHPMICQSMNPGLALVRHQRMLQREDETLSDMHDFKRYWKTISGPPLSGELTLARGSDWFTPDATKIAPLIRDPHGDDDEFPVCGYGWYGRTSCSATLEGRIRSASEDSTIDNSSMYGSSVTSRAAVALAAHAAEQAAIKAVSAHEQSHTTQNGCVYFVDEHANGQFDTHDIDNGSSNSSGSGSENASTDVEDEHAGSSVKHSSGRRRAESSEQFEENGERQIVKLGPVYHRAGIPLSSTAITSTIEEYTAVVGPAEPDLALCHYPSSKKTIHMSKSEIQQALDKEIMMAEFLHDMDVHLDIAIENTMNQQAKRTCDHYLSPADLHQLMSPEGTQVLLQAPASAQVCMFRERGAPAATQAEQQPVNSKSGGPKQKASSASSSSSSSSSTGERTKKKKQTTKAMKSPIQEPLQPPTPPVQHLPHVRDMNFVPSPYGNEAQQTFEAFRSRNRIDRSNYAGFDTLFAISPSPMTFFVMDPEGHTSSAVGASGAPLRWTEQQLAQQGRNSGSTKPRPSVSVKCIALILFLSLVCSFLAP
jgi:hypothetical protein